MGLDSALAVASILIIDDDPYLCILFSEALSPDYYIETCNTCREGIQKAKGFDLIILDLLLDDNKTGVTVLRELQQHHLTRYTPVILISGSFAGYTDSQIEHLTKKITTNARLLPKPVSRRELRATVELLLDRVDTVRLAKGARETGDKVLEYALYGAAEQYPVIADGVVDILAALFVRIWILKKQDVSTCKQCEHYEAFCTTDECLEIVASSGKFQSTSGKYAHIPVGKTAMGRLVLDEKKDNFLRVSMHEPASAWEKEIGVMSYGGYQIVTPDGVVGCLGVFSGKIITRTEIQCLRVMANKVAAVYINDKRHQELRAAREQSNLSRVTVNAIRGGFLELLLDEFKYPAQGIMGQVASLQMLDLTPEQREHVDNIQQDVDYISRQLKMAHLDHEPDRHPEIFNLCRLVETRAEQCQITFARDEIKVWVEFEETAWLTSVAYDIDNILLLLIHNAREAMFEASRRELVLKVTSCGKKAIVKVTDTGGGIPCEDVDDIWDTFYSTKKKHRGMGLAQARKIAQQLGGGIDLENNIGVGCTFSLWLPK